MAYKVILESGEYKLPASWDEVTFEQLINLRKVNFSESAGNILSTSIAIASLMGCDNKELMKLDSESFVEIAKAASWMHEFNVESKFKNEFEFEGKKYKLVENFNNLSIGEMASIEQFVMEDADKNADKIMAILVRDVDENGKVTDFNPDTLEERASVLRRNLTIPELHGLNAFFLDGAKEYMTGTQVSSLDKKKIQILKMT